MEATGVYHLRLADALLKRGWKCSVVNPLSVKRYAQMCLSITKNDAQDAITIARFAGLQPPADFKLPDETTAKLKQRRSLLNQLQKEVQVLDNQLEALELNPQKDSFTIDILQKSKASNLENIALILREIKSLLQQEFPADIELLKTIPGVGEVVAQVFIETARSFQGFENEDSTKAFTKFVGLAPTCHRSGTSVRGASHINRSGAPNLRSKLYLPAVTAATRMKEDNPFKQLYHRLREAGKAAKEAIVAVMHKMVRIACAVLRRREKFSMDIYGKKNPIPLT
jgi:transposase